MDMDSETEEDLLTRIAYKEEDVFLKVLMYLNCQSLASLEETCHSMKNWIEHFGVWEKKLKANQKALWRVEKEQKIKLNTDSAHSRRDDLQRLDRMENNLVQSKSKKMKTSFYEIFGFNECEYELKMIDCSYLLINKVDEEMCQRKCLYDLHTGKEYTVVVDFEEGNFLAADIENDLLAILRYPLGSSREDGVFDVDLYRILSDNNFSPRLNKKNPDSIMNVENHGICRRVKIIGDSSKLLVLGVAEKKRHVSPRIFITSFNFELAGGWLEQMSVRVLDVTGHRPSGLGQSLFRLQDQFVASVVSPKQCYVWDHKSGDCVWRRKLITRTSIPAVTLTSLAFSHPHLAVGSSDGTCQLWDVVEDSLIRTIEHEKDSGLNMGFRQLELSPSLPLLFSLTQSGWLVAWHWAACLDQSKPASQLIAWKTNTKHRTPIIKFAVNSSRIVSLEEHQMTCQWDVRRFVVVRDFWQYKEKMKTEPVTTVKSKKRKRN